MSEKTEAPIHQRLRELIGALAEGKQARFAEHIGVKSGVIGDLFGVRKSKPGLDLLTKILAAYPELRADWLLMGTGPMLAEKENMPAGPRLAIGPGTGPDSAIIPRPIGVPMVTVDSDDRENISLVSSKAAASYPTRYLEPEYYQDLPAFSIPLPEFRNATFRAFQVVGDSMSPTFYPGGWVMARFVDFTRETIQEGYIHVVVTRENLVVKRVLDRIQQRGTLALQSDNEEFQTYEVPIEDVQEVWRVVADIGFKFPNVRYDTRRRLSGLEVDLQNLMARLEKVEKRDAAE